MTTLDEIAARADAATLGPWEVCLGVGWYVTDDNCDEIAVIIDRPGIDDDPQAEANAIFISSAREDVPKLVAALRAVEKLVGERYKLWAAICGETCVKEIHGVNHDAIADSIAAAIETAIRESMS